MKEFVETLGWLKFIAIAELLPRQRIETLTMSGNKLCSILGKSVSTAKANRKRLRPP